MSTFLLPAIKGVNGRDGAAGAVEDRAATFAQRVDGAHLPARRIVDRRGPVVQRINNRQLPAGGVKDRRGPLIQRGYVAGSLGIGSGCVPYSSPLFLAVSG
jgi:hypothetical protein